MTMVDILKLELKDGMALKKTKELSNKFKVTLSYNDMEATADLPKSCAPGCEREVCHKTIDTILSTMYINAGDLQKAKKWLEGEYWKEEVVNNKEEALKELVNALKENRDEIALRISEDIDYYSFLQGFDYVLDEINYILNK